MENIGLPGIGGKLTEEELRSATGTTFTLVPSHRRIWRKALETLNAAKVPYAVTGAFAVHHHTGIWRNTRDMDVVLEKRFVDGALQVLADAGFNCAVVDDVWLGKAKCEDLWVDLIFGGGNGLIPIDALWHTRAERSNIIGVLTKVAPPEDLFWMKAFVQERHRFDGADVVHLINETGHRMDWAHVCWRFGDHWKLLLIHILLFDCVFPGRRAQVPEWVRRSMIDRFRHEPEVPQQPGDLCLGALLSRFSYLADLREKGYVGPSPGNAGAWYTGQAAEPEVHQSAS